MTVIEVSNEGIYLSTDDRSELVEISAFIVKNYERMRSRDQKAVTLFETRDIPGPLTAICDREAKP